MVEELLMALVGIIGTVAGVYIRKMLASTKQEKLDTLTKYGWIAIRSAKDQIKGDNKGAQKFNIAMKILKKEVSAKEGVLEDIIRASFQQMKGLS